MTIQIGHLYNSLKVLEFSHTDKLGHKIWKCECCCGKLCLQPSRYLGKTKSCGCQRRSKNIKGEGEIYGSLFSGMRFAAKRRRIVFDVSPKFLWQLFLKQERKCALSDLPLDFGRGKRGLFRTASLDRIDSSKGYTEDNVQWVHRQVNVMKHELSYQEFQDLVERVFNKARKDKKH
jgi:hypothetical protein